MSGGKKVISWERYEEIKTIVSELFEDYKPEGLPVDIFGLAKQMGIKIVYSSEILNKNNNATEHDIYSLPISFLHYYDRNDILVVYIDDIGCQKSRQRFSLAHEIGHIILGHKMQSPENEEEANFVAEYLLAPTSLVMISGAEKYMQDPIFIVKAFNVSLDVAYIAANHMINRYYFNNITYQYEDTINDMYKESLWRCIKIYDYYH